MDVQGEAVEISNPMSKEYTICRPWVLPSLVKNLASNKHRLYPQKMFEIGDCIVLDDTQETKTRTLRKLSGVISYDNANLTEMKSVIENVLNYLGYKYEIKEHSHPSFIDSRVGEIVVDGKSVGMFGELHPKILEKWKLEKPVIAFEIDLF